MWTRVLVATLLFGVIFWIYFQIDPALQVVRQHAPEPDSPIRFGKVSMRQIDVLCRELIPKMNPHPSHIRRVLICHHYTKLVPAIFVLASLTGWCASIWLLALQRGRKIEVESGVSFVASLLLAFIVGIIAYLLLISPFNFFKGNQDHLEKAAIFPLLGGLFLRTFFDRVSDVLSRIFDLLTGKRKPQSDKDKDKKKHDSESGHSDDKD